MHTLSLANVLDLIATSENSYMVKPAHKISRAIHDLLSIIFRARVEDRRTSQAFMTGGSLVEMYTIYTLSR